MNEQFLEDLVKEWQALLRVQDWTVDIRFARRHEIGPNRSGEVDRIDAKKFARISVLDPNDWDTNLIIPQDVEVTVVHELLHLHFAIIDSHQGTDDVLYEQAINALSISLVKLKRAKA